MSIHLHNPITNIIINPKISRRLFLLRKIQRSLRPGGQRGLLLPGGDKFAGQQYPLPATDVNVGDSRFVRLDAVFRDTFGHGSLLIIPGFDFRACLLCVFYLVFVFAKDSEKFYFNLVSVSNYVYSVTLQDNFKPSLSLNSLKCYLDLKWTCKNKIVYLYDNIKLTQVGTDRHICK